MEKDLNTFLDWSNYKDAGLGDAYADIPKHGGDFAKAVAVCINSKKCEEHTAKSVMCPAFRVTGNKELSTGGRVRLLKEALNAQFPEKAITDESLVQAMKDCVACKGCKRECENNVDMAMIKSEFLAQRNRSKGVPLRSLVLANFPKWLSRFGFLRTMIKMRNRSSVVALLTEKFLGLSKDSTLPEPVTASFSPPMQIRSVKPDLPEVVLFIDTFARHFNPEIADSALHVLDSAGYKVHIVKPSKADPNPNQPLCCGRTYLAQGMIDQAQKQAWRLIDALVPHMEANRIIIGLEPSCILGLRDDYLMLNLNQPSDSFDYTSAAQKLAKNAFLFEEFLAKEIMTKRLDIPFMHDVDLDNVLVHGHCHQKAVGAMKSMRKILKYIPQLDFEFIDSGCCGMAGSYGVEAENAEKSRLMARERLIPAIEAQQDKPIIANGFSCRHQIKQHTGKEAKHIAQILSNKISNAYA